MTRFTEWRWSFASGDAFVHGFEAALKIPETGPLHNFLEKGFK